METKEKLKKKFPQYPIPQFKKIFLANFSFPIFDDTSIVIVNIYLGTGDKLSLQPRRDRFR